MLGDKGAEQLPPAGLTLAAEDSQCHITVTAQPKASSMAAAPRGSAQASSQPAEVDHPRQQQATSSVREAGSGQEEATPAGGRRFTPAQQAVAAALMVVLKRANRDRAAIRPMALAANNEDTKPMLIGLMQAGLPFPSLKEVEQVASDKVLCSLARLAALCAEAECQPLEVFTRSVQCTQHHAAQQSMCARNKDPEAQRQLRICRILLPTSWCRESARALQQLGVQKSMAALVVTFLQAYRRLLRDDYAITVMARVALDHMLPGTARCSLRPLLSLSLP